jgi:hypothetical protein
VHLSAILVTGNPVSGNPPCSPAIRDKFIRGHASSASLACAQIFGRSVLERTVERLQANEVRTTVITAPGCTSLRRNRNLEIIFAEDLANRWSAAKLAFHKHTNQDAELVLFAELGAYVEFNLVDAVRFHRMKGRAVTAICDNSGSLGYWVVEAKGLPHNPSFSLPFGEEEVRGAARYLAKGYINRLEDAGDLRRLVVDAFMGRCCVTPQGREIKPGVWVDESARLHRTARLVAPVYVGRNSKVETAAVITRFSNVEDHCSLGARSVVADSSVLSHTSIGRGLDLSSAVVDGGEFADLRRKVTLTIEDPNLIAAVASGGWRAPRHSRQPRGMAHLTQQPEPEYSQYLTRAAGRLFEAFTFKGEA